MLPNLRLFPTSVFFIVRYIYSYLAQLHQLWQNWLQVRLTAIVTRLDAHRRDIESSVKVSSEGGRHQTTPYCRNRRRHCARAESSARVRVHRAVYTRCRAVAPAPPASTISQHSAAVAATWLKGLSGCRRAKVRCRGCVVRVYVVVFGVPFALYTDEREHSTPT